MPVTIERVSLMNETFSKPLGWDDVIGLASASNQINIEIEASGVTTKVDIPVLLWSHLPNSATADGLIPFANPLRWEVPQANAPASSPGRTLFRLNKPISAAGPFLNKGANDVATIVRDGGTSDQKFRDALGWTTRGIGKQPTTVGASTGNELLSDPDALSLLKAGGVDVLGVVVVGDPSWQGRGLSVSRLIRKPCRIVYYSGHGLSWNNCLGIETVGDSYACWATAADLVGNWTKGSGSGNPPETFIIAGCSLLRYQPAPGAAPINTIGLAWADLLSGKKGPLTTLLGYAASAPSDKTAGDALATEMGKRIAGGSTDLVTDWLELNGIRKCWNATAMDSRGYWWLEPRKSRFWGHEPFTRTDIKGPLPIP